MPNNSRAAVAFALIVVGLSVSLGAGYWQPAAALDSIGNTGIRAADPSIIETPYGLVAIESRGGRALFVWVARSLDALAEARPVRIWSDRNRLGEVWAPELVFWKGRYVVYFTAGVGSDHRMYRIESTQPDAGYGGAIEILLPDNRWAIDGVPFSYRSADYIVWSGWQGTTDIQQDLYIARLDAAGQPEGPSVLIASPDKAWENVAGETPAINEGPQPILDPAGQLHLSYSANGSWGANYCLADLRLRADGDPLDPADWFESDGCLLGANKATLSEDGTLATRAKGVGHHSFILADGWPQQSADDAMPFLYHGVPAAEEPSNFWAARRWFIGSYQWVPDVTYGSGSSTDTGWGLQFFE